MINAQTVKGILNETEDLLKNLSISPRLDAEILLGSVLKKERVFLHAYPDFLLTSLQKTAFNALIQRRLKQEPVAYLTGTKSFWSLDFKVTQDTLIPRPETEMLVEWILNNFSAKHPLKILDLGTGSGAIAVSLAHERPHWTIHASDICSKALAIAKENAYQNHVANIEFFCGDFFAAIKDQNYDIIVSNPPYLADNDPHLKDLAFEPILSLTSGIEGLNALTQIIQQAPSYLKSTGWLVLEHGYHQASNLQIIFKKNVYTNIQSFKDLSHIPRMMVGQKTA